MSKKIAYVLKERRNELGYTPDQVINLLSEKGHSISTKALYAYESGTNMPKLGVFFSLCEIYKIHDVMKSFGYSQEVRISMSSEEWPFDYYEDFFNATLLEKVYLLVERGVPSFEGYQDRMTQREVNGLSFAENEMISKFRRLDQRGRAAVLNTLEHEYSSLLGENTPPAAKNA